MRTLIFKWLVAVGMMFLIGKPVVGFADAPLSRKVLAFYNAKQYDDVFFTPVHRNLEFVLNHLGLEVVYQPYQNPLPPHDDLKDYVGILVWNRFPVPHLDVEPFCRWLLDEMDHGRKLAVLEYLGMESNMVGGYSPLCQNVFSRLGVNYAGEYTDDPLVLEVTSKNPAMMEFERKLNFVDELKYTAFKPNRSDVQLWFKMRRLDLEDSESSLVITSNAGGYAHPSFVLHVSVPIDKRQWILNPYRFFTEAYGLKGRPVPDTSTLNGRRIFYSQIDGDGIFNVSHIDRESFSGKIILDEILNHYQDLPFTVSLITGYFDMPPYQGTHIKKLYHDLLSPAHIEVSSHGYAHPLNWLKGTYALDIPGYQYNPRFEVQGSMAHMQHLLQELRISKPVELYQWTGNCLPLKEHIGYAEDAGFLNINGGDSYFDDLHNSQANLRPLSRLVEGRRQIYSSFPNENVYTNLWHGPYYGYKKVIESFINTKGPAALKPINIYYHFYSGEHLGSLSALKQAYDYALSQPIFPLFTTEYVRLVQDFFAIRIFKDGEGYRVENNGDLRTLRFDGEDRFVDLEKSSGILGFVKQGEVLYVHLSPDKIHHVVLSPSSPKRPYLSEAGFAIRDWRQTASQLSFSYRAWIQPELILGGFLSQKKYRFKMQGLTFDQVSDPEGKIHLQPAKPDGPGVWQDLKIEFSALP